MSRLAAPAALCALALATPTPGSAARKPPQKSWAQAEIKLVVARGLLADDAASFRPEDPLTRRELDDLVAARHERRTHSAPGGDTA